jgi:single-strand DNA-binding protein
MANETVVTVIGNVVADPELRVTPSGASVVKLTVASTPRTLDRQTGEWRDSDALFMRCTAWRDLADNLAQTLHKGDRVIVHGRLKQENWEDKDTGGKRSAIVMEVDEIGPSLRFAQAQVTRTGGSDQARSSGGFGSGSTPARSSNPVKTQDFDAEPPF